jgi:ribosome-associated translation inhibitor RaiA
MMKVIFKNLEPSDFARHIATEKLEQTILKFPDVSSSSLRLTLEMHNSPVQAGPDSFSATLQVLNGRYRGVRLSKTSSSLYVAIAELSARLLEKLNRFGDKRRVKSRGGRNARWSGEPSGTSSSGINEDGAESDRLLLRGDLGDRARHGPA